LVFERLDFEKLVFERLEINEEEEKPTV